MIRPDFILSYWIFLWYIAYILKITTISPKILFVIGIIENIWTMFVIWGKATTENFIYFILVFIFTKVIPFATIWNVPIKIYDIYYSLLVSAFYGLWIYINRKKITLTTIESLIKNKNETPGIWFFHYLKNKIKYFV
jgi:hypothetical protein